MQKLKIATSILLVAFCSTTAFAQFGKVLDKVKKANDTLAPWTPEQENAIGQASAAKMIHVMGLIQDPALTKYVQYVGSTVARQATRPVPYHFAILEAKTPDGSYTVSAFALPGGYVFVTKGALNNMTDEAQLAGVLAHEIAHVDSRHLEKEIQKKKSKQWAMEEGTSHIPGPAELKNIANDIIGQALLTQVNPKDEDDADKKGTTFAAGAGYDATGLRRFLEVLQEQSKAGKVTEKDTALWARTHPPIAERIARLNSQTATAAGGQTLPDRFKNGATGKPVLVGAAAPAAAAPAASTTATTTPASTPASTTSQPAPAKKKSSLLPH